MEGEIIHQSLHCHHQNVEMVEAISRSDFDVYQERPSKAGNGLGLSV